MEDSLSVALYARVSSQRQVEETTIHSQVAALKDRIAKDGLHINQELCFLDEGYSGSSLLRPALERLRDVAFGGGIDRLYVYDPDRLARKHAYQVLLLEEFKKFGVQVVFLNHQVEAASPEGDLLLQVQGIIAEYERAKITERSRRGRRFAARQGKISVLTHAPYGYCYVTKQQGDGEARYDVVLEQARVVRDMFYWVGVEGLSIGTVIRRLAAQNILTATGKPRWDRATVLGILKNSAYRGAAQYGKTRSLPRKLGRRAARGCPAVPRRPNVSRPTLLAERETIPVPALVAETLFQAVAEQLEVNRRRQREQYQGPAFLLSGLMVCHLCGSAYCGRKHGHQGVGQPYTYYRCLGTDKYRRGHAICGNKSLHAAFLEAAVWQDVSHLLKEPDRLRREFERRLQDCPAEQTTAADELRQSITQLKGRMARLIDAYENGWLEKPQFESRVTRVKERLSREERSYAQHEKSRDTAEGLRLLVGEFERFATDLAGSLDHAEFATRRKILKLLIKQIEVDKDEVRIVYKVQPRPFVHRPARGTFLQDCLKHPSAAARPDGLDHLQLP